METAGAAIREQFAGSDFEHGFDKEDERFSPYA